jgi:hypothetical protein
VFQSYPVETLSSSPAIRRLQIATLIGNLSRSLYLLTVDIEHEEARVGVCDPSDPTYPVLARSLRARRDNIMATVAMLESLRAPNAQRTRYRGTGGAVDDVHPMKHSQL